MIKELNNELIVFKALWLKRKLYKFQFLHHVFNNNRLECYKLRGKAATKHQVPLHVASKLLYYYRLIKKIQNILIELIGAFQSRPKIIKTAKVHIASEPIESLMDKSQHVCTLHKQMIVCSRCCQSRPRAYNQAAVWLSSSCSAIGTCSDRPIHLPLSVRQLGNNIAHHSHTSLYLGDCTSVLNAVVLGPLNSKS